MAQSWSDSVRAGGAGFEPLGRGREILRIYPGLSEEYWVFFAGGKAAGA